MENSMENMHTDVRVDLKSLSCMPMRSSCVREKLLENHGAIYELSQLFAFELRWIFSPFFICTQDGIDGIFVFSMGKVSLTAFMCLEWEDYRQRYGKSWFIHFYNIASKFV